MWMEGFVRYGQPHLASDLKKSPCLKHEENHVKVCLQVSFGCRKR